MIVYEGGGGRLAEVLMRYICFLQPFTLYFIFCMIDASFFCHAFILYSLY